MIATFHPPFKTQYIRASNRKNIRCFPSCREMGHMQSGFCGQPVTLVVRDFPINIDQSTTLLSWGEFADYEAPFLFAFGQKVTVAFLESEQRSSKDNHKRYLRGDQIFRNAGRVASLRDRDVCFCFNQQLLSYSCHWKASTKSQKKCSFVAHIFKASAADPNVVEYVLSIRSPGFELSGRKRAPKAPVGPSPSTPGMSRFPSDLSTYSSEYLDSPTSDTQSIASLSSGGQGFHLSSRKSSSEATAAHSEAREPLGRARPHTPTPPTSHPQGAAQASPQTTLNASPRTTGFPSPTPTGFLSPTPTGFPSTAILQPTSTPHTTTLQPSNAFQAISQPRPLLPRRRRPSQSMVVGPHEPNASENKHWDRQLLAKRARYILSDVKRSSRNIFMNYQLYRKIVEQMTHHRMYRSNPEERLCTVIMVKAMKKCWDIELFREPRESLSSASSELSSEESWFLDLLEDKTPSGEEFAPFTGSSEGVVDRAAVPTTATYDPSQPHPDTPNLFPNLVHQHSSGASEYLVGEKGSGEEFDEVDIEELCFDLNPPVTELLPFDPDHVTESEIIKDFAKHVMVDAEPTLQAREMFKSIAKKFHGGLTDFADTTAHNETYPMTQDEVAAKEAQYSELFTSIEQHLAGALASVVLEYFRTRGLSKERLMKVIDYDKYEIPAGNMAKTFLMILYRIHVEMEVDKLPICTSKVDERIDVSGTWTRDPVRGVSMDDYFEVLDVMRVKHIAPPHVNPFSFFQMSREIVFVHQPNAVAMEMKPILMMHAKHIFSLDGTASKLEEVHKNVMGHKHDTRRMWMDLSGSLILLVRPPRAEDELIDPEVCLLQTFRRVSRDELHNWSFALRFRAIHGSEVLPMFKSVAEVLCSSVDNGCDEAELSARLFERGLQIRVLLMLRDVYCRSA